MSLLKLRNYKNQMILTDNPENIIGSCHYHILWYKFLKIVIEIVFYKTDLYNIN